MSILASEQLFGWLDGNKGNLQQEDGVHQLVAGRGMFLEEINDPFSACLMEMDLTTSIAEDFMVEEYARVPSPSVSNINNDNNSINTTPSPSSQCEEEQECNTTSQMDPWNQIPAHFQAQLFTHYGLYLKEVQQVLDLQLQMDSVLSDSSSSSSVTSSPASSTPASPAVAQVPKTEKRKKTPSFRVDHYKLYNNKRIKREDSEPLSPNTLIEDNSDSNSSFSYRTYFKSEPTTPPSNNYLSSPSPSPSSSPTATPRSTIITVAEELASAFLPSINQIEEEIRAGTSSASAATTVIELTKRPELLTLKQSEAARIMGISTSVLSKRWREATRGKKWPHRIHHKLKRAAIC